MFFTDRGKSLRIYSSCMLRKLRNVLSTTFHIISTTVSRLAAQNSSELLRRRLVQSCYLHYATVIVALTC